MGNTIYSPSHEEGLPEKFHDKARLFVIDRFCNAAEQLAPLQFGTSLEKIINPTIPTEQIVQSVTPTNTPITESNSTAYMYNQNFVDGNPVINQTTPNAKTTYVTAKDARVDVERAFDETA